MPYRFDGVDDALALKDVPDVLDFTMACAFRRTSSATGGVICGFDNFATVPRNGAFFMIGGPSEAYINNDGSGAYFLNDAPPGTDGTLVIRRSGTTVDMWVNGLGNGENNEFSSYTVGSGAFTMTNIRVGCHGTNALGNQNFCPADIASWGLWVRAWTSGEIAAFAGGTPLGQIDQNLSYYYLPLTYPDPRRWRPPIFGNPQPV